MIDLFALCDGHLEYWIRLGLSEQSDHPRISEFYRPSFWYKLTAHASILLLVLFFHCNMGALHDFLVWEYGLARWVVFGKRWQTAVFETSETYGNKIHNLNNQEIISYYKWLPSSMLLTAPCSVVGFLSQLAQGKSMDDCVRCGHYAANYMIQQSGVTLLDSPKFS